MDRLDKRPRMRMRLPDRKPACATCCPSTMRRGIVARRPGTRMPAMFRCPVLAVAPRASAGALMAALVAVLLAWAPGPAAHAAHALAWGADPRYPPGFQHFDYVNPRAPRGGTVNRDGFGTFDKLNPFTLRGISAAGLGEMMFETLGDQSWDEPFSVYGLLAEDMALADDRLSITFRLNPAARFWNGDPVLADDVAYSFQTLMGKFAHPRYAQYFADVESVKVVSDRVVRFDF